MPLRVSDISIKAVAMLNTLHIDGKQFKFTVTMCTCLDICLLFYFCL